MAKNLFSIPIFFIVFRETLEAAIIVSVLLGLVEQIVSPSTNSHFRRTSSPASDEDSKVPPTPGVDDEKKPSVDASLVSVDDPAATKRLVKRLRWQIFLGACLGFIIALAIGAAFIAVWFTQAADLWSKSENLWEGIFSLIASILIFIMGLTMLKLDRAKSKWKVKLQHAFHTNTVSSSRRWFSSRSTPTTTDTDSGEGSSDKSTKLILFLLPFITVLREGMEAIVFVGGVSLGQPATAIPIAAIVGIICGLVVGVIIYAFASRAALSVFLVVMTNFLLLIGAGLFSQSVGFFQANEFTKIVGAEVDDTGGDGPGSFRVKGNVWHIECCNPENNLDGNGWGIFAALFGWTNSATLGTVLAYVFYWIAVMAALVWMKWREGRVRLFGKESAVGLRRRAMREASATAGS